MIKNSYLTTVFLILGLFTGSYGLADDSFHLSSGQTKILRFAEDLEKVTASVPGIVSLRPSPNKRELTIVGKKNGRTTVTIELRKGAPLHKSIVVGSAGSLGQRLRSLKSRLNSKGFNATIEGSKVILTGSINSRDKMNMLYKIMGSDSLLVDDRTRKPFNNLSMVARSINIVLRANQLGHLKVKAIGKVVSLLGIPKNKQEMELALRISKHIYR